MRYMIGLVLLVVLLLSTPLVSAKILLEIDIDEHGKIISHYDEYYVTNVNGTLTLTNPSNMTLYGMEIPMQLFPLTIIEDGTSYISGDTIYIISLQPYESISFDYRIIGISSGLPTDGDWGVLHSALRRRNPEIKASLPISLSKAPIEDPAAGGLNHSRLVSVFLQNPSGFEFKVRSLAMIKTTVMDPNDDLWTENFIQEEDDAVIEPFGTLNFDVYDRDASEGDIYWLKTDIFLDEIDITGNNSVTYLTIENVTLVGIPEINETIVNFSSGMYLEEVLFIRKYINDSLLNPGDIVKVSLIMDNLEGLSKNVSLIDTLPRGFELVDQGVGDNFENLSLFWNNVKIGGKSRVQIDYLLKYVDESSVGVDFFPAAEMSYKDDVFRSARVLFIRKYVPQMRVYLQKKISYSESGEVEVLLEIQNIGEADLLNILLKEYLASEDVFREITQAPEEKGLWRIPLIKRGDTWQVSYVTNDNVAVSNLPDLYGVESEEVLKTIIFETVVNYSFLPSAVEVMEIIGLLIIVSLPIAYYFLKKRDKKKHTARVKHVHQHVEEVIDERPKQAPSEKHDPKYHMASKEVAQKVHETQDDIKHLENPNSGK